MPLTSLSNNLAIRFIDELNSRILKRFIILFRSDKHHCEHPSLCYRDVPKKYIRDPRLGHRLGRNSVVQLSSSDEAYSWLGTNRQGFYGHTHDIRRFEDASYRIIVIGASSAMGLGASGVESLFYKRLEDSLKYIDSNIEVINACVGDYSSSQCLLYLVTELVALKPNLILHIDGFNDFTHSSLGTKYGFGRWLENTTRSFDDSVYALLKWDHTFDRTYQRKIDKMYDPNRIKKVLERRKDIAQDDHCFYLNEPRGLAWDSPEDWVVRKEAIYWYLQNLISIQGVCMARSINYIHLLQPSLLWTKDIKHIEEYHIINKFRKRLGRLVDIAPEYYRQLLPEYERLNDISQHSNSHTRYLDPSNQFFDIPGVKFVDAVHYNDFGQQVLSEISVRLIVDSHIF